MNAIKSTIQLAADGSHGDETFVSEPLEGRSLSIGHGFEADSFRAQDIGWVMDPLVMVDHYVMTEPTFGAHPHAGMSAVTLLFDDSEGLFHNRDSLGNDFDLQPGDLYWLKAGSGAVHDESPRENARTHGLQVFVNLPESRRFEAPASLLVREKDMPVISTSDYCIKVALGESNGVAGPECPALPMTILDGMIQPDGHFSHAAAAHRGVWVQAVKGSLQVAVGDEIRSLESGQALAISIEVGGEIHLSNASGKPAQFALFDGEQVDETYVQEGPFVMGSIEQIADIKAAYDAGRLGGIDDNQ